jgi:hypothetical protein
LKETERQTGAQIFLFAAYEKPDGVVNISKYNFQAGISLYFWISHLFFRFQTQQRKGDPFAKEFSTWRNAWKSWEQYANDQFGTLNFLILYTLVYM